MTKGKVLKGLVILLFAAFALIQFFGIDRTNPPVNASETLAAAVSVPPDISEILGRSCNDCHSNQTVYPWYSRVQPFAWFLKGHIDDGRREMNLSVFNTYTDKKKARKLEEICDEVEGGAMPLPSYLWIHSEAALSDSERKALCEWAGNERAKLAVSE